MVMIIMSLHLDFLLVCSGEVTHSKSLAIGGNLNSRSHEGLKGEFMLRAAGSRLATSTWLIVFEQSDFHFQCGCLRWGSWLRGNEVLGSIRIAIKFQGPSHNNCATIIIGEKI